MIERGDGWELRLGRWQDVLKDVRADAVICDPPYGSRTHENSAAAGRNDGCSDSGLAPEYASWTEVEVDEFVGAWSGRCNGWMLALTDSDLANDYRRSYVSSGRYAFAPVPCVMRGMNVRLTGDGPSSWSVYAMAARPANKAFATWGTLPGAYTGARGSESGGGRGKPDWLMNALVRDYSRPGDLIVDPFAGWGATLESAVSLGRRTIGAEMNRDAFDEAVRRLRRMKQTDLFGGAA